MSMIQQALAAPHCIVSYIGAHAGEGLDSILARKTADIQKAGHTFWVFNAYSPMGKSAFLDKVHKICQQQASYVIFVKSASKGKSGTTREDVAQFYSVDEIEWRPFDARLSAVTGKNPMGREKLGHMRAFALGQIKSASGEIDLADYTDALQDKCPISMSNRSTTCIATVQGKEYVPPTMSTTVRQIVAVGKLAAPYCVYVSQQ